VSLSSQVLAENYVTGEVFSLHRSDTGRSLGLNRNTGKILLEGSDADLEWEAGGSIALGWDSDWGLFELKTTYYGDWDGGKNIFDPNEDIRPVDNLQSDDEDFTDAYSYSIDYDSTMWGVELMRRQALDVGSLFSSTLTSDHTLSYGLSYINVDEDFRWNTVDNPGDLPGINGNSDYTVDTDNHLMGVLVGLDGTLIKLWNNTTHIVYGVKAGAYANYATQETRLQNDLSIVPDLGRSDESEWGFSGLVDVRLGLDFHVHEAVTIGMGFRSIYVTGLALAPDQITFGSELAGPALNHRLDANPDRSDIVIYGGYLNASVAF
jgi:hypothetical protein